MPITYVDSHRLQLTFSCLIFRVPSLRRCGWTPHSFTAHIGWGGETNGHLLLLKEMNLPGHSLWDLADALSQRSALREWDDFVYVEEQLLWGVGDRPHPDLGLPLAQLTPCPWLGSILAEEGNFVWLRPQDKRDQM